MSKGKVIILSIFSLALLGCGSQLQQHAEAEAPVMSAAKNTEASKLNVQLGLGYLQQGKRELAKTKLIAALQQAPTYFRYHWEVTARYRFEKTKRRERSYTRRQVNITTTFSQGFPLRDK